MNQTPSKTPPQLPEPEVLLHSPTHGHVYGFTEKQMHAYAREYAATLAAAAGGRILARGWFHALPAEDDYEFHDDASGAGKGCSSCIRAMIVPEPSPASPPVEGRAPSIRNMPFVTIEQVNAYRAESLKVEDQRDELLSALLDKPAATTPPEGQSVEQRAKYRPELGVYDEASLRLAHKAWESLEYLSNADESGDLDHEELNRRIIAIERAIESHAYIIDENDKYVRSPIFRPAQAPSEAVAIPTATDQQVTEWVERHDLGHAIRGTDARAAYEDAQCGHLIDGPQARGAFVPLHPTAKMTIAMHDAYKGGHSMVEAYAAMIASASGVK